MPTTTESPPAVTALSRSSGLAAWWRQAWARPGLPADEAWLKDAADLADLERRLRQIERGRPDRFGPLPAETG